MSNKEYIIFSDSESCLSMTVSNNTDVIRLFKADGCVEMHRFHADSDALAFAFFDGYKARNWLWVENA